MNLPFQNKQERPYKLQLWWSSDSPGHTLEAWVAWICHLKLLSPYPTPSLSHPSPHSPRKPHYFRMNREDWVSDTTRLGTRLERVMVTRLVFPHAESTHEPQLKTWGGGNIFQTATTLQVLTSRLRMYYLQLTDQPSGLVEAVTVLTLQGRQQVAGIVQEAQQVLCGGGEVPPLPHQPIDVTLPLPDALGSALPPVLQFGELWNKFRSWEKQMVR